MDVVLGHSIDGCESHCCAPPNKTSRELHLAFAVLGTVLNAGLSKAVKRLARHARPQQLCAALGTCHKYGMPSSHAQASTVPWWPSWPWLAWLCAGRGRHASRPCVVAGMPPGHVSWQARLQAMRSTPAPTPLPQVMAFALAWRLLVGVRRWQRGAAGGQHTALFAAEAAGLAALTGVVGAARVYLGYHSADQVLAGVVLGAAAAAAWFAAVGAVAPAVLPAVLRRSAPLRALVLRDTLWRAKPD